jgi:hypothetical protein
MAELIVDDEDLVVRLTLGEKIWGFHGDIRVRLSSVVCVAPDRRGRRGSLPRRGSPPRRRSASAAAGFGRFPQDTAMNRRRGLITQRGEEHLTLRLSLPIRREWPDG